MLANTKLVNILGKIGQNKHTISNGNFFIKIKNMKLNYRYVT
jgi:hypothetical protein